MKMPKETVLLLEELLEQNPSMSKDEFKDIFKQYFLPDTDKLVETAINRQVNGFIAKQKGNDGIRKCFNVSVGGERKIVNIEKAESLDEAVLVMNKLRGNIKSRLAAAAKAKKKVEELDGQLVIDDFMFVV